MDKASQHFYTTDMKYTWLVILMGGVFLATRLAVAQEESDFARMSQAYAAALSAGDEDAIDEAWEALNRSPQSLAYLRRNDARLFQSYEYWRIKRELRQLRENRALPSYGSERAIPTGDRDRSNSDRVRENPNQERRDNRTRALATPNQERRPNQDVVNDTPNQDRSSNQERIRNRLRALR